MALRIVIILSVLIWTMPAWAQQEYVSPSMGFSLNIPAGWEIQTETEESLMLVTTDRYPQSGIGKASVIVAALKIDQGTALDVYLDDLLTGMMPRIFAIEQGDVVINERAAIWLKWEEDSPMTTHATDMTLQYYFPRSPQEALGLSFRGDKEYLTTIREQVLGIVQSLRFK